MAPEKVRSVRRRSYDSMSSYGRWGRARVSNTANSEQNDRPHLEPGVDLLEFKKLNATALHRKLEAVVGPLEQG